MTAKKSLLIILRIFFVLLSILFIKDAFYRWDGMSFYMEFIESLPIFHSAFFYLSIIGLILAFSLWLILYLLLAIINIFSKSIKFEHIWTWLVICVILVLIKKTFINISLHELTGLSHLTVYTIGGILVAGVVLLIRKYIKYIVKLTDVLNDRITPLVWLFVLLFVLAVPLSFYEMNSSEAKSMPQDSSYVNTSGKKLPNIITVVWDTTTARDMSLYGYNHQTTPFVSEWAKNAIVFNKAYASSNWTSPSTMSMLTGQRPWTHRYWHAHFYNSKGKNYDDNLLKVLKDNGYAVYSFVQNSYAHPDILGISEALLVNDNCNTFIIPRSWWFDKLMSQIKSPIATEWILLNKLVDEIATRFRPDIHATRYPSEKVYNRFLDYISEINSRNDFRPPFFAYLHVYPPHDLYLPPKPYMGKFGDAEKLSSEKIQLSERIIREYEEEAQEAVDILRKRYDEFVLYSDQRFKSFISRLSEIIDMSNTIIILSSDHGESFSHGYQGHDGPHLYESLVHIPLIIKIPGKTYDRAIDIPVEQPDIAPTILDFAGIPVPDWMEGRSLFPLIEGNDIEPRPVFSMQLQRNSSIGNSPITKGTLAVWDGDYKLIHYLNDNKTLLFNVKTDPDETRNIASEKPEIAQRLKRLIDDNLALVNKKTTQSRVIAWE